MILTSFAPGFAGNAGRRSILANYALVGFLVNCICVPILDGSDPYLAKDINQQIHPIGSHIGESSTTRTERANFLSLNDISYFFANDGVHGRELWRSDGTPGGAWLVKDISPGPSDSTSGFCSVRRNFVSIGETLYFIANDGAHGLELWRSDGTISGTQMVKDILPGPRDSCPFELTVVNDTLFFAANDGLQGAVLWRSDGTAEGTVQVDELNPEGVTINYYYYSPRLLDLNGVLTFVASSNVGGDNIWRSDGTPDGTYALVDAATMPPGWYVDRRRISIVDNELYFFAISWMQGIELWRTDGTREGTTRVTVLGSGFLVESTTAVAAVGGRLYFQFNNSEFGAGLWTSDGTEKGTRIVRGGLNPTSMTPVEDMLFIVSFQGSLWRSDGTEEGTLELAQNLSPRELTAFGDRLAFMGIRDETGAELWTSDGTVEGTEIVIDLNPGSGHGVDRWAPLLHATGEMLYFTGDNGTTGPELWESDGTALGTRLVRNIRPDVGSSSPGHFRNVSNRMFFAADDGITGMELWISNGTDTRQVRDIRDGPVGSIGTTAPGVYTLSFAIGFSDVLLFSAQDGVHGMELWRSDGTKDGTYLVKDAHEGWVSSYPSYLTKVGRQAFFRTSRTAYDSPLWRTDGTEDGTYLLFDDPPWDYGVSSLAAANDRVLFNIGFLSGEWQTWWSDGTPEGTETLLPFAGNSYTTVYFSDGEWQIFFQRWAPDTGREIWRTDGTIDGTRIVKDIAPGSANGIPPVGWYPEWQVVRSTLYFLADDGITGLELWKSDGTKAGTQLVKDIRAGKESAFEPLRLTPFTAASFGGVLYFAANDGIHGRELWRTDGTAEGTYMVVDIVPGPESSSPSYLTAVTPCGPLYFAAYNHEHGMEVWKSDGTEVGTYRVSDIQPGYLGSSPRDFTVVGSTLYFAASDGTTGEELWELDVSDEMILGDYDCDGATTLVDFEAFLPCVTGPNDWARPSCEWADSNRDGTIDLYEIALFQAAFGPYDSARHNPVRKPENRTGS
jgi:ELWxxDGT repeat protein